MSEFLLTLFDRAHMTPAMAIMTGSASIIIRSTAILCIGGCIARWWPRASAAQRHLAWTITCAMAMIVPLLRLMVPAWTVVVGTVAAPVATRTLSVNELARLLLADGTRVTMASSVPAAPLAHTDMLMAIGICVLWALGTLITIVAFVHTHIRARTLVDETVECDTPQVLRVARVAASTLTLPTPVTVRYHATAMPFVYGIVRPTIVLPVSAASWSTDRLRDVFCHELAHVARRDIVAQLVASFACAMYWFNPLAWIAARMVRTEREIACDDRVLAAGSRPSQYASHLLDLAGTFEAPSEASVAALAFARPAQIHMRLHSIVDPVRRRTVVTPLTVAIATVLTAGFSYPLMALTPTLRPAETKASRATASADRASSPSIPLDHDSMSLKRHVAGVLGAAALAAPHGARAQDSVPTASVDSAMQANTLISLQRQIATLDSVMQRLRDAGYDATEQRAQLAAVEEQLHHVNARIAQLHVTTPSNAHNASRRGVIAGSAAGQQHTTVEVGTDVTTLHADSIHAVTDLLEKRVPGLTVTTAAGTPTRIRLRGTASVNASSNDPIVVINGVRVQGKGSIDQIDPNNIASVEVFKGPSATAKYGADAANGVIVITTKAAAKK